MDYHGNTQLSTVLYCECVHIVIHACDPVVHTREHVIEHSDHISSVIANDVL